MSPWKRYKQALVEGRGFWIPLGFVGVLLILAWLTHLYPGHLVTDGGAELQLGWLEALANLLSLVPLYLSHHTREKMQAGGLLAFASITYVWPFLLAGMTGSWRDRLEGRPAGLRSFLRNGHRNLVKVIGWGVQVGVLSLVVLALLHLPLNWMDDAPFASAAFHEAIILPLSLWIFFAYLLPLAIARAAGYDAWRVSRNLPALALIGLPLTGSIYLPVELRRWVFYLLLPFYALAVETLADGARTRPAQPGVD